jgi:hypothetical protein
MTIVFANKKLAVVCYCEKVCGLGGGNSEVHNNVSTKVLIDQCPIKMGFCSAKKAFLDEEREEISSCVSTDHRGGCGRWPHQGPAVPGIDAAPNPIVGRGISGFGIGGRCGERMNPAARRSYGRPGSTCIDTVVNFPSGGPKEDIGIGRANGQGVERHRAFSDWRQDPPGLRAVFGNHDAEIDAGRCGDPCVERAGG